MVKLEEVEDEELNQAQPGPVDESDDDYVDTDSSLSDDDDATSTYPPAESLTERLSALKDMVPPATRRRLNSTLSNTFSASKGVGLWGGKVIWTLVTSALLVSVPFAIAAVEDQQIMEQEKELKAQEELRGGLSPGAGSGAEKGVGPTL